MRNLCLFYAFYDYFGIVTPHYYAEIDNMNNTRTSISTILQNLISTRGLSTSEVARLTSVPQSTLHRIIHGEHRRPHKKTLTALANFFGVSENELCGIQSFDQPRLQISRLPILTCQQAAQWPNIQNSDLEYVVTDKMLNKNAFAIKMPDESMEPMISKNSILIVDPDKKPEYRSIVAIKLHNFDDVVIRQLIRDANNCYIRPISQDFTQFEMVLLNTADIVKGTVIESRMNCEEL